MIRLFLTCVKGLLTYSASELFLHGRKHDFATSENLLMGSFATATTTTCFTTAGNGGLEVNRYIERVFGPVGPISLSWDMLSKPSEVTRF